MANSSHIRRLEMVIYLKTLIPDICQLFELIEMAEKLKTLFSINSRTCFSILEYFIKIL